MHLRDPPYGECSFLVRESYTLKFPVPRPFLPGDSARARSRRGNDTVMDKIRLAGAKWGDHYAFDACIPCLEASGVATNKRIPIPPSWKSLSLFRHQRSLDAGSPVGSNRARRMWDTLLVSKKPRFSIAEPTKLNEPSLSLSFSLSFSVGLSSRYWPRLV